MTDAASPSESSPVWREPFRVRAYEIGADERASLLTLCDYFQEAAGNHASALGVGAVDLAGRRGVWVMHRLRLRVETARPAWRETVTVETWPSAHDGLRAWRDFVIRDAAGAVLVRGTSVWFVIDLRRRRPVRLPEAVRALSLPDRAPTLPHQAPALEAPPEGEATRFRVRRADLDRNGHANNVRFVEWALESVSPGVLAERDPVEVEVQYKSEAVLGDTVLARTAPAGEDGAYRHVLVSTTGGQELARLVTRWALPEA